jgi:2-hydroxychromene-2-carboxylate isomerase
MKGAYSAHDFARSARLAGVNFRLPDVFPVSAVNASRVLLWLQSSGSAKSVPFVHTVFRALFTQNRDISDPAVLTEIGAELTEEGRVIRKTVKIMKRCQVEGLADICRFHNKPCRTRLVRASGQKS